MNKNRLIQRHRDITFLSNNEKEKSLLVPTERKKIIKIHTERVRHQYHF